MSYSDTKTTKGLLGKKLGMTQVWDENNKLVPVTVIEISPNVVTQIRTTAVDGYNGVQIAAWRHRPAQGQQAGRRPLRQGRRHASPSPHRAPHCGCR
jgi:ribosomal protein L3